MHSYKKQLRDILSQCTVPGKVSIDIDLEAGNEMGKGVK